MAALRPPLSNLKLRELLPAQPFHLAPQQLSRNRRCRKTIPSATLHNKLFLGLDFGTSGARAHVINGMFSRTLHLGFTKFLSSSSPNAKDGESAEAGELVTSSQQDYGSNAAADWPAAWHRCDSTPWRFRRFSCQGLNRNTSVLSDKRNLSCASHLCGLLRSLHATTSIHSLSNIAAGGLPRALFVATTSAASCWQPLPFDCSLCSNYPQP